MPGTIVVVVVLGAGELHCPPADAAIVAMRGTLAAGEQVLVREVGQGLDDGKLSALRTSTGASAIVEIAWSHPDHQGVHLHVGTGDKDFADRDLGFTAADAEDERGRTVGLVLSSMLEGTVATKNRPLAPRPRPLTLGLDLLFHAAHGLDADEGTLGARVGLVLRFDEGWLRGAADMRIGRASASQADLTFIGVSMGGAAFLTERGPFRLSLGAELGVGSQWVERHSAEAEVERQRWVLTLAPFVHASWTLGGRFALAVETGPTVSLPRSRVKVGDDDRGALSQLGWFVALGGRFAF